MLARGERVRCVPARAMSLTFPALSGRDHAMDASRHKAHLAECAGEERMNESAPPRGVTRRPGHEHDNGEKRPHGHCVAAQPRGLGPDNGIGGVRVRESAGGDRWVGFR